ncbi:methyltransferase domain-containing protein [Rhodococcus maanshanensis]|uniref:class I SAM-dependent methyltransferase n=1 Tax=Rhodococcus maanshanensis TaxID=183556 RepID=UPI0022B459C1|nr:class I SAM-dependent methyltransferase [Rhodococcus maanshanensis]MCZ4556791.1 methyltransferase domain-containing protein [Rhodococcus maanshanensis]
MSDAYAEIAEFYDLAAASLWARKGPVLAAALRSARPDLGPILDIGAGTGLSTEIIADTLPDAAIIAVEPSPQMRIALSTRIAIRGLADRVTVVPEPVGALRFPDRLGGAVCYGVLGHLAASERTHLLATLRRCLAPGAPTVIELMDETAPPTREPLRIAAVRVGDCDYEVWSRGATGESAHRWTLTYRVLRDGITRREVHAPMPWAAYGLRELAADSERARLFCNRIAADVAVLTPA